ncbi:ABC transporter permease subunit [Nocardioides sp. zg-536]|uniref:ABC transporter permease subunit n=2 Tax=Nocardioides faecalis TaxID=2803858 RepID=A0A938Y618_9ACTN|nr:ABC transporter permease subunit [Nocardioides faecalis]MBS4754500.1 ABC transporter permease subunit [Nocardioides faecalis]QVI60385.1 ABC transporter permease subunit [Nocardioides faecalis]
MPGVLGWVRAIGLALLGLVALVGAWEGYKALVPENGVLVGEQRVLPRTTDLAMPHVWDMVQRLGEPTTSMPGADPLWRSVLDAAVVSLGIAGVSWLVGTTVGLLLAVAMARLRVLEWGLLPWIILSQTIPLIAFAPVVRSWGSRMQIGSWEWPPWLSVAVIAAYLAFFPVAVGALRGLQAHSRIHADLFHAYAAGWWSTLLRVRIPSAVPYLLPALRLGAASAVVGTVVAEVSTGFLDGIGRMLVSLAGQASGDPAKAWAPIFGAIALGLVAGGIVTVIGVLLRPYRRGEAR